MKIHLPEEDFSFSITVGLYFIRNLHFLLSQFQSIECQPRNKTLTSYHNAEKVLLHIVRFRTSFSFAHIFLILYPDHC